jgi:hypothetical protein
VVIVCNKNLETFHAPPLSSSWNGGNNHPFFTIQQFSKTVFFFFFVFVSEKCFIVKKG